MNIYINMYVLVYFNLTTKYGNITASSESRLDESRQIRIVGETNKLSI